MSRCFPFPPPGFVKDGACGDALIESIKLQNARDICKLGKRKDRDIAKKEKKKDKDLSKKERKKDHDSSKKERKKDHDNSKKERKKERDNSKKENKDEKRSREEKKDKLEKHSGCSLKRSIDECQHGRDFIGDGKVEKAEHLENSTITEEHDLPSCSHTLFYSSDGTQSSYKRRKQSPPCGSDKPKGNIIKIRLTLPKQPELETKYEPCSTSERVDSRPPHREAIHSSSQAAECSTSLTKFSVYDKLVPGQAKVLSSPLVITDYNAKAGPSKLSKNKKEPHTVESMFKDLIENWVPPSHMEEDNLDDQDWLFQRKEANKSRKVGLPTDISLCRRADLWPQACFLPEADVFALPYTVPF